MSRVDPRRIIEDRAINRVTSLLQEHGHIVQKIDGHNDFGEDLYVSFTEDGYITGDTIAVQVKGGISYRRADDYGAQIRQHGQSWLTTNVPVVCVVHDPETDVLYWANASEQLRLAKSASAELRSISISRTDILDDHSIRLFAQNMRDYIVACGEIRHALRNLSGCAFDTTDYISYFMNEHSEDLIFRQRRGEDIATLLHSDWNWDPIEITPEALTKGDQYEQLGITTLGQLVQHLDNPELKELSHQIELDMDLRSFVDRIPVVGGTFIVNNDELAWLRACSAASSWWRSAPA